MSGNEIILECGELSSKPINASDGITAATLVTEDVRSVEDSNSSFETVSNDSNVALSSDVEQVEDMYKIAALLKALNKTTFEEYCDKNGIDKMYVVDICLETPELVMMCMQEMLKYGIWLGFLFNHREIWSRYMLSIVHDKYRNAVNLVLSLGTPGDLIVFFRACYKFGYEVIDNEEYDALERFYLETYPELGYLRERVNEDSRYSEVVQMALKMSVTKMSKGTTAKAPPVDGMYSSLNFEKSTSIMPLRTVQEVYDYLKASPTCRTHWSLKMDGFNVKALWNDGGGGLNIALSRGRATDSWDYTTALKLYLKAHNIDETLLSGKITGEALVDASALDILRAKYPDKDYKSSKSTAGAMLRAPQNFEEDDYKFLNFYPFEYDERMKDVAFAELTSAGLTPPPAIIVEAGDIPLLGLAEFTTWLNETILDPLWSAGSERQGESDGVVLQLLTTVEEDRADKYSDLNVALKFSHWSERVYESTVRNIIFEQQRVLMSVVIEVDPVVTRDMNVATRVSAGSPAILVRDGVRIGDKIRFIRRSEAINVYEGKC